MPHWRWEGCGNIWVFWKPWFPFLYPMLTQVLLWNHLRESSEDEAGPSMRATTCHSFPSSLLLPIPSHVHSLPPPITPVTHRWYRCYSRPLGAFCQYLSGRTPCLPPKPPLYAFPASSWPQSGNSQNASFSLAVWLDLDIACILNASPVCRDQEREAPVLEPACFWGTFLL